eukprot:364164-Chlamydomonas_euryale.AAC.4
MKRQLPPLPPPPTTAPLLPAITIWCRCRATAPLARTRGGGERRRVSCRPAYQVRSAWLSSWLATPAGVSRRRARLLRPAEVLPSSRSAPLSHARRPLVVRPRPGRRDRRADCQSSGISHAEGPYQEFLCRSAALCKEAAAGSCLQARDCASQRASSVLHRPTCRAPADVKPTLAAEALPPRSPPN